MMLFVSQNMLEDLGLVLCVAAATTVLFRAIRQPVVVGYLVAGMIVGPHVPIPLLADSGRIHMLSELGVILLMFALGLEFSLRKLLRLGPTAGFVTALQVGLMIWLGFVIGRALGWSKLESIFTGTLLSISSTTIVAKAYGERPPEAGVRDLVFSVLLAEDLTAVMLLAVLTALASGAGLSTAMMARTVGRLVLFLIGLVGGGLLIVPAAMRRIVRLGQAETTLIASIGICFAFAVMAERAGYSVALGAFLAGSLVAESGAVESIGDLVVPVRDLFAAVFFVSVGMMIEPQQIAAHWLAMAVLVAAVLGGKLVGVTIAALLSGSPLKTAVQAGMSLMQIGEFSFIIAGVGIETHATREFLYTLAVAVSAITTFTTPFLIRASEPCAEFLARHLPGRLRSMQTIYDALMERTRGARFPQGSLGRAVAMLVTGAVAVAAILIVNEQDPFDLTSAAARMLGVTYFHAGLTVDLGALIVCVPFAASMFVAAGRLAHSMARRAIPADDGEAAATIEAVTGVLQATLLLVVVMPMLALVQPFVAPLEGIGALVIGVMLLLIVIWRAARKLQRSLGKISTLLSGGPSVAGEIKQ
jgi:CPA2 family monovalent cation:H+ antiporter-2